MRFSLCVWHHLCFNSSTCESKEARLDCLFIAAWLRFLAVICDVDDGWFEGVWKGSSRTANPDILGGFFLLHGGWPGFPPFLQLPHRTRSKRKYHWNSLHAFKVSVQARQILGLGGEKALDIMMFFLEFKPTSTLTSNLWLWTDSKKQLVNSPFRWLQLVSVGAWRLVAFSRAKRWGCSWVLVSWFSWCIALEVKIAATKRSGSNKVPWAVVVWAF